jgi:hypothetical protein
MKSIVWFVKNIPMVFDCFIINFPKSKNKNRKTEQRRTIPTNKVKKFGNKHNGVTK